MLSPSIYSSCTVHIQTYFYHIPFNSILAQITFLIYFLTFVKAVSISIQISYLSRLTAFISDSQFDFTLCKWQCHSAIHPLYPILFTLQPWPIIFAHPVWMPLTIVLCLNSNFVDFSLLELCIVFPSIRILSLLQIHYIHHKFR